MRKEIVFLLLVAGCKAPPIRSYAPGDERELVVVFTQENEAAAREIARGLSDTILTPRPNPIFKPILVGPAEFEARYKGHKNVLILATPGSRTFELYTRALGEPVEGLSEREGCFGEDDLVLGLYARDPALLASVAKARLRELRGRLWRRVMQLYRRLEFYPGVNRDRSREIAQRWGLRLEIPMGWAFIQGAESDTFFAMAKHNPDRFFFVYVGEPRSLDPGSILDLRDALCSVYYGGDSVLREQAYLRVERDTFLGEEALVIYGVWQNDANTTGGPFKSICFNHRGRFYMLDAAAWVPDKDDKLKYVLRTETILRTLKTQ